jgi:membrane-associated protease RseP (regulator of RpoE activity)
LSNAFDEFVPHDPRYTHPPIIVEAATAPPLPEPYRPTRLTWKPVLLFAATCYTTTSVGNLVFPEVGGLAYSIPLLVTLLCHEFGHFLQARRWRVTAGWPYFIPIPFPPLGTMGAVINMRGHMGNRRALFDIGISGPLAGLVPALAFSIIGLRWSSLVPGVNTIGMPALFGGLRYLILGPIPPGYYVDLHPMAYAGWVGIFITALNLIPIGQLDGGHVLYALLRRKAHIVAQILLIGALVGMMITNNWGWLLMILLLIFIGPNHPPTADDSLPLGRGRTILGWLTLCFMFIGFTPHPFL